MQSEPLTTEISQNDPSAGRSWRWVLLIVAGLLAILLLLLTLVFVVLGSRTKKSRRQVEFGASGPAVRVRGVVGPIDVQRTDTLAEKGIQVQHAGTSARSSSSLFGHQETRTFTVRVTAGKAGVPKDDLGYTLLDEEGNVMAEGDLVHPELAEGEHADATVTIEIANDDGTPTRLLIRKKSDSGGRE